MKYVQAACDHAFFDIASDLTVLAFFGAPVANAGWIWRPIPTSAEGRD